MAVEIARRAPGTLGTAIAFIEGKMNRLTSDEIEIFLQYGTQSVAQEVMAEIPFDEVNCLPLDQKVVWRQSAIIDPSRDYFGEDDDRSLQQVLERPKLEKGYMTDGINIFTTGMVLPGSSATSSSCTLKVPRKPMLLMRTHFICDSEIDVIVSNINQILSGIVDLSCEFNIETLSVSYAFCRKNTSHLLNITSLTMYRASLLSK